METSVPMSTVTLKSATRAQAGDHYAGELRRLLELRGKNTIDLNGRGLMLLDRCIADAVCQLKRIRRIVRARKILEEFSQEEKEAPDFLRLEDHEFREGIDTPPSNEAEGSLYTIVIE